MRLRRLLLYTACVFVAAWIVLPIPPEWIEHVYARGLYRVIAAVVVTATELPPFSLSAVLLILASLIFLLAWRRAWRRLRADGQPRKKALLWGPKALLALTVVGYALFVLLWGAGYRRPPIEDRLHLPKTRVTAQEIEAIAGRIAALIRRELDTGFERDEEQAFTALRESLADVIQQWDGTGITLPSRIKTLPAGTLLAFGVPGMISPFLLEPHVDGGMPATSRLAVGCHEMAHVAGLCGEADADLASFVAGLRARDPFARYAVALRIYSRLYRALPKERRAALIEALPEAAQQDLRAATAAHRRYEIRSISKLSNSIYDGYLKAQGVADGVGDYGRSVSLLVKVPGSFVPLIEEPLPSSREK